jgi:phospholipid/cholesterol/gamma-HCH transport system ATP-binding protein
MDASQNTIISSTGTAANESVLEVRGLKKAFGTNVVLNDFDLTVHNNESVVVLGRSGSGKSVLIKCIIGLLEPDEGSINVLGQDVLSLDHAGLDHVRMRIGFLFQSNALYDSMTVRENLEFPMRRHLKNMSSADAEQRIKEVLSNVGLAHTIDMMPAELSGGMQKRIALARTLVLKPEIILYDEPTSGLDPITGREISTLMVEVEKKYHTASIIISHDMRCVKITADRIVVLIDGRAYATGTYEELKSSTDEKVKQFFE